MAGKGQLGMLASAGRAIERMLIRNPEILASRKAAWRFMDLLGERRGIVRVNGKLAKFYDERFGRYDPIADVARGGKANVLDANPQLRRMDVVAEEVFAGGSYAFDGAGPVISPRWQPVAGPQRPTSFDGTIAIITLRGLHGLKGALTLDVDGEEVKFTKLRIGAPDGSMVYTVRLSVPSGGITVEEMDQRLASFMLGQRDMPETVGEPASNGSSVFTTIRETVDALVKRLGLAGR